MMSHFLSDDRAISPIIATALMLAIGVSMIGFIQMHYVPVWNAQEEMAHFDDVFQDMNALPSSIENSVAFDAPRTNSVRMGLTYTNIPIFYNPTPTLFGGLEVTPTNNITISYTYDGITIQSPPYISNTIRYKLPDHADIVYEHGIIITDYSAFTGGNITKSQNTIIDGDNIEIPLLFINGNDGIKTSSVAPATIAFYPVQNTDTIRPANLSSVNITIETQYPFVWEKLLLDANTPNSSVRVNNVTKKIYINTSLGNEIKLPNTNQDMQLNRLYTGMISVKNTTLDITTTSPGSSQDWSGQAKVGMGNVWTDIPLPPNAIKFNLTNLTVDTTMATHLDDDVILFKIVDESGNYWVVLVEFEYDNGNKICSIKGTTSKGTSYYTDYDTDGGCSHSHSFTKITQIDLLNSQKWDHNARGSYQNSSIGTSNSLVFIWMGENSFSTGHPYIEETALIYYKLIIQ